MKKGRKLLLILLTLLLVFSSNPVFAVKYSDTVGHWAQDYIDQMSSIGFVTGYDGNKFKPDNNISKVEFFSIINSMANLKKTYAVTFSDVKTTDWFYEDVSKAIKAGYLTPTTGKLNPHAAISRQDVMGIVGYMYKLKQNPQVLSKFKDGSLFTEDNRGYAGGLVSLGVINGAEDSLLRPNEGISRAEICKILFLLMDEYGLPGERVVVDSKIKFGDKNLYN
ncbi:S-layer homology domain-containing protein [Peptoniphilus catoniae]|uniref:S-layer homology domain-containing protein n=1 Tax=Peptoniphilus catoniae TaxID=1660341 RepID=UPI0010FD690B|nr:S-layer homology domain-containing protein [Peptoniphilus catoniae]